MCECLIDFGNDRFDPVKLNCTTNADSLYHQAKLIASSWDAKVAAIAPCVYSLESSVWSRCYERRTYPAA